MKSIEISTPHNVLNYQYLVYMGDCYTQALTQY